jgi:hypothetical protein
MNYESLYGEVTEQWGGPLEVMASERFGLADLLARVSLIAWNSLAHPPSGEEMVALIAAAGRAGTRSTKPRTVLRKLIEHAEREHGWVATPEVMKAAGKQLPKG